MASASTVGSAWRTLAAAGVVDAREGNASVRRSGTPWHWGRDGPRSVARARLHRGWTKSLGRAVLLAFVISGDDCGWSFAIRKLQPITGRSGAGASDRSSMPHRGVVRSKQTAPRRAPPVDDHLRCRGVSERGENVQCGYLIGRIQKAMQYKLPPVPLPVARRTATLQASVRRASARSRKPASWTGQPFSDPCISCRPVPAAASEVSRSIPPSTAEVPEFRRQI